MGELPVLEQLDERLALGRTDGFRYEDMPPDPEAWRISLAELDRLAGADEGGFAAISREAQEDLLRQVQRSQCLGPLPVRRLWPLWLRYGCAALYSLPAAWNEIGFGGPAYPRGYKNLGLDRREPWETPDAAPSARSAPLTFRR